MTRLGYILMLLSIIVLYIATGDSALQLWAVWVIGAVGLVMLAVGAKLAGVYYHPGEEDEPK